MIGLDALASRPGATCAGCGDALEPRRRVFADLRPQCSRCARALGAGNVDLVLAAVDLIEHSHPDDGPVRTGTAAGRTALALAVRAALDHTRDQLAATTRAHRRPS